MRQARLELLGGFQLLSESGQAIPLVARKPRALLAYLALSSGRPHPRERLAMLLWSDSSELQARTSLRQALTALRRALAPVGEVIRADGERVGLAPESIAVDAVEFERAVGLGTTDALHSALLAYRGDLLDGFSADAPAFEQWLVAERERLRLLAVQGLASLLDFQRRSGLIDVALETAARLVALDPLREDAQRELLRLYAQQGRIVEALKQYQLLRQVLARELGVPPAPETEQLYREILQQRRSAPPSEAQVLDAREMQPAGTVAPDVRHAIVLLIDLHPFIAFCGEIDPEAVHGYLLRYRAKVGEVVQQHGGTITNYIGARVMAAFGVPTANDNDAERAVRTALALREVVPGIPAPGAWHLRPQIGLASGPLFADATHGALIISGEPVSMAVRIMEQAGPGDVLASGWVQHAVADRVQAEPMPAISIRAVERPIQVWRLTRWLERVPSARPFVGRQPELRQLSALLDGCLAARTAQVLLVRGDAGIGKSQLLEEMMRLARARGFACHRVLVLDFGSGTADRPLPALARALLGVADSDGAERIQGAILRAVDEGKVERELAPVLRGLLDVPAGGAMPAQTPPLDALAQQRVVQRLLVGLLTASCNATPLLLVVEDVHWADAAVLKLLAALGAGAHNLPLVLALSTRTESDPIGPAWRAACAGCAVTTVDLGPLTLAEARTLAAGYACEDTHLIDSCVERAEGNPLFLDQLLRGAQSGSQVLPSTVQSIVLSRLDRLTAGDRQVLQAACVLGQRFAMNAVQHLSNQANCACEDMIERGLVRPQGDAYIFSHALIQEAIYASLRRSQRDALHRRAADWFLERDPALAAEHLDAAGDAAAATAYERAAALEIERHQYERALQLAERGLALAQDQTLRFRLGCRVGELLRDLGRSEASVQTYRGALELASTAPDKSRALCGLAAGLRILDRVQEALAAVGQAETLARERADPGELARINLLRGNLYFPLGEIDACLAANEAARAYAEAARSPELEAQALSGLGDAHYLRGEMLTAHDYFRRCVALARRHALASVEAASQPMVAITHFYRNEADAALATAQEAVAAARRIEHLRAEMIGWDVLGLLHVYAARWQQAFEAATRTLDLAQRLGARRFEAEAQGLRGWALHALGDTPSAEEGLAQAYAIACEVGVKDTGPWLLAMQARVTRDRTRRDAALAEGEAVLERGCVSHAHLHFYENAIEACLAAGEIDRAEGYARALWQYTQRQPSPWSELIVRRAHALAQAARGLDRASLRVELETVLAAAEQAGLGIALPAIEAALARL